MIIFAGNKKMREFIDKTSEIQGTPLNRDYMMAIQGFDAIQTVFNDDGSIVETNSLGETKTTKFNDDGTITETFVGEKTLVKTIHFESDGNIREVLS